MKRMKSEMKRYQAPSVAGTNGIPSTRPSFDVDISLARNEIVSLSVNLPFPQAYIHAAR
jgi:hypothetical protein